MSKLKGKVYDTETAEEIGYHCGEDNNDEDTLYRTKDGHYFVRSWRNFLESGSWIQTTRLVPISEREAMIFCIKTGIPKRFQGYVLSSI